MSTLQYHRPSQHNQLLYEKNVFWNILHALKLLYVTEVFIWDQIKRRLSMEPNTIWGKLFLCTVLWQYRHQPSTESTILCDTVLLLVDMLCWPLIGCPKFKGRRYPVQCRVRPNNCIIAASEARLISAWLLSPANNWHECQAFQSNKQR